MISSDRGDQMGAEMHKSKPKEIPRASNKTPKNPVMTVCSVVLAF